AAGSRWARNGPPAAPPREESFWAPAEPAAGPGRDAKRGTPWGDPPFANRSAVEWRDIAAGAPTARRGGARPAGGLLGGTDPAGRFGMILKCGPCKPPYTDV